MLEIILLWKLLIHVGRIARQKGYATLGYQIMTICLWASGELTGYLVANYLVRLTTSWAYSYGVALFGALSGAGLAFLIMKLLPQRTPEQLGVLPWVNILSFLPAFISIVAINCLFVSFGGSILVNLARTTDIAVKDMSIYTDINGDDPVLVGAPEVSVDAEVINFVFYLDCSQWAKIPLDVEWYVNDDLLITFSDTYRNGFVTVQLSPDQIHMDFPSGWYKVEVWQGDQLLNSMKFFVHP